MQKVFSEKLASPVGPYSPALRVGKWIFFSGQIGLNLDGNLIQGSIEEETRQVLKNLQELCKASGIELSQIVKTTIFLTDLNNFFKVNEVYEQFFKEPYPARSTVGVSALPKGARVEIEAIAIVEGE